MRNIFDQYSQPENRLTHALLSCLAEDHRLCRQFLVWTTGRPTKAATRLEVSEQSLPGDRFERTEEDAERQGLPDGVITAGDSFALIIESKVAAPIRADQLRRHMRTVRRRGLADIVLLVIAAGPPKRRLPRGVVARSWTEVYKWLFQQARKSRRRKWAQRCIEYLEVAEMRGASAGYLREGTLTTFSGIPFGPESPYSYHQAKRLLGLLRMELCKDKRLTRQISANLQGKGRPAITGREEASVWDFIPLKEAKSATVFTQHPHFTFGLHTTYVEARITIPNGIRSRLRTRLLGTSKDSFQRTVAEATYQLLRTLRRYPGATPEIVVVQRHYLSQRSVGTIDCLLQFDPRTMLVRDNRARGPVKGQPQWLAATYDALASRRSNIQFQIGARFPYRNCKVVGTPQIARAVANVWIACKPMLEKLSD